MSLTFEQARFALRTKLSSFLIDQGKLRKGKTHLMCLNPEHRDLSPSMSIKDIGGGEQLAYCFGCGETYDIFTANHLLTGAPLTGYEFITDNLKPLADKYDVKFEPKPLTPEELEQLNMRNAIKIATDYILQNILSSPKSTVVLPESIDKYLNDKQINSNSDKANYKLGYVGDWAKFKLDMASKGIDEPLLIKIGIESFIFSPNNLLFTITDEYGNTRGFAGRNCNYDKTDTSSVKYFNSKLSEMYDKKNILYNLHKAIKKNSSSKSLYIVEGYTDAITLDKAGLKVAALCGTALTTEHISLLQKTSETDIVVLLDGDATGKNKGAAIITKMMENVRNFRVRIALLPENHDPDSFVREFGLQGIKELRHYTTFEWRLLELKDKTDLDEYEIVKQVIPLIVNESSYLEQEKMAKHLSAQTNISVESIQKEVSQLINAKHHQSEAERDAIIETCIKQFKSSPNDALLIAQSMTDSLKNISKKHAEHTYDGEEVLNYLEYLQHKQENPSLMASPYFRSMPKLERQFEGDTAGKVLLLGGEPNAGKCEVGHTPILLPTGQILTIKEVVENRLDVLTLDLSTMKIRPVKVNHHWDNGVKPTWKLTTWTGKHIEATANHPFLTKDGWKELQDLRVEDKIAAPRRYNLNILDSSEPDSTYQILGYLIGDGGLTTPSYIFTKTDIAIVEHFKSLIVSIGDSITPTGDCSYRIVGNNMCGSNTRRLYESFCGKGKLSKHKTLPDMLFTSSNRQIALFLNALWSCDGSIIAKEETYNLEYSSASEILIEQMQHLLLRFGIVTRKRHKVVKDTFNAWILSIANKQDIVSFIQQIGFTQDSEKYHLSQVALVNLKDVNTRGSYLTGIDPQLVLNRVNLFLANNTKTFRLKDIPMKYIKRAINRKHMLCESVVMEIADMINDDELRKLVNGDIFFDEIVSIEYAGEQPTYDLTIDETHNFIAADLVSHNTSFMLNMITNMLTAHEEDYRYDRGYSDDRYNDTSIILHSIDDGRDEIIPRLVSIIASRRFERMTINYAGQPYRYTGNNIQEFMNVRAEAFQTLTTWIKEGRLSIKDVNHGATLTSAQLMVDAQRQKFGDKNIWYFLDNLFDLKDYSQITDTTKRESEISSSFKHLAVTNSLTAMSTVEYNKTDNTSKSYKQLNKQIKGAKTLEYDGNWVGHLINDIHNEDDKTNNWWADDPERATPLQKQPIITLRVAKNKITSFKGDIHYLFAPDKALYHELCLELMPKVSSPARQTFASYI